MKKTKRNQIGRTYTITAEKIRANRKNAKKCTGPTTEEGKQTARQNAVKHGLLAKQILIKSNDPNESLQDYDAHLSALIDAYQPRNYAERCIVERIAATYWRLRRAYRFEAAAIERANKNTPNITARLFNMVRRTPDQNEPQDNSNSPNEAQEGTPTESMRPHYILPTNKDLDKLLRYETQIQRDLHRTHLHLDRIRRNPKNGIQKPDSNKSDM